MGEIHSPLPEEGLLRMTDCWERYESDIDLPQPPNHATASAKQEIIYFGGSNTGSIGGAGMLIREAIPDALHINWQSGGEIDMVFTEYGKQLLFLIQDLTRNDAGSHLIIRLVFPKGPGLQWIAGLSGLLRVASNEYPLLTWQMLEIGLPCSDTQLWQGIRECLFNGSGLHYLISGEGIAIRRWRQHSQANPNKSCPWRDGGVYLITGGAGKLGMIFSREILSRIKNGAVILTGRSSKDNRIFQNMPGTEYLTADISKRKDTEKLILRILATHGKLSGIIHAAGVIRDSYIRNKTPDEIDLVFGPKVSGLVCLDEASKDLDLDFLITFSSISAVLGLIGQGDYAMANAFMDHFAVYRNELVAEGKRRGSSFSLNWGLWQQGGMKVNAAVERYFRQTLGMAPISTPLALEAFYDVWSIRGNQAVIACGDIERLRAGITI